MEQKPFTGHMVGPGDVTSSETQVAEQEAAEDAAWQKYLNSDSDPPTELAAAAAAASA